MDLPVSFGFTEASAYQVLLKVLEKEGQRFMT